MDSREEVTGRAERRARLLRACAPGGLTRPTRVDALLKKVRSYNPKADLDELTAAYRFAEASTRGRSANRARTSSNTRRGRQDPGRPAAGHPDLEAALLHDAVEDTEVTLEEIEEQFGEEVARSSTG